MFEIPRTSAEHWLKDAKPKASDDDIRYIEKSLGRSLPKAYVEFIREFGFVLFGNTPDRHRYFNCTYGRGDRTEVRLGNIAFLRQPEKLINAYDNLTQEDDDELDEDEREYPKFPEHYLPVGSDAGQDAILLELEESPGQVWYWCYSEWAWGFEDNTELGFVAKNFYDFVNGLRVS